jgi:predicted metalloprotease with PDZ domain
MTTNFRVLSFRWLTVSVSFLGWAASALGQTKPIRIEVDATDAPRSILHARLTLPAQAGPLTLLYPKWIPGEHAPTGPVTDLVGLKMSAAGQPVPWVRDSEDMFVFHLEVPKGAQSVEVSLDFLLPPKGDGFSSSASSTARLLVLSWNQVLLYPQGPKASEISFAPDLRLPEGWKFATALPLERETADVHEFGKVSLETLVDSPLIAGPHLRTLRLAPDDPVPHWLHIVADSAAALEIKPHDAAHFSTLVKETGALFGARHYRDYHFLLTLSDNVAHFGLEHHQSSDNRRREDYLTNPESLKLGALLLPHEMVHSWNGKYRRPAGLATPDYEQPMKSELLWVYEGLTEYLGNVLTARCGLWTDEDFREDLALSAAILDHQVGRKWRPLADTTTAAQLLYEARAGGTAWRRSVDFYPEGELIWLEADTVIRRQTGGRRTLDDFCQAFHGGKSGPPQVKPYTYDDLVEALAKIASYDWRSFFQARVYDVDPRAPVGGIEASGWRLIYNETIPDMLQAAESIHKFTDLSFSLGLSLEEGGGVRDVIPGSPAARAGVAPAMKLVAVNGRRWTAALIRKAIQEAKTNTAPIELLVENGDFFQTCAVDYHDGEKYPHLERDPSKPDLLEAILQSRAAQAASK